MIERKGYKRWPGLWFRFGRSFYKDGYQSEPSWHYSLTLFGHHFWWVVAP